MSNNQYPKATQRELLAMEKAAVLAVEYAQKLGVANCQAYAGSGERVSVKVREGKVELLSDARSTSLRLRLLCEQRAGCSSTNDLRPEAIRTFVERTLEMAQLAEPDPLSDPPKISRAKGRIRELEEFDPQVAKMTVSQCLKEARQAEKVALKFDRKITASEGASCARTISQGVYVTGNGFVDRGAGTSMALSTSVIADDADQKKRRGSYFSAARFLEDVAQAPYVGEMAAQRSLDQIGATQMATGRYPVVFEREAAAAIVQLLSRCVLGGSIYRGRSYLANKLGKKIGSSLVNIVDDPWVTRGFGSRVFDAEGQRCKKRAVVERGVLQSFLLDTYSARKLKMDATASAAGSGSTPYASVSNFYLKPGKKAPERLFDGIKEGLFVTDMMGFGFDPVNGNFSRGAEGFRIVDGALAEPVGEITISRNLDELLQGIEAVANDLYHESSIASPSFRVDHMTVSGR